MFHFLLWGSCTVLHQAGVRERWKVVVVVGNRGHCDEDARVKHDSGAHGKHVHSDHHQLLDDHSHSHAQGTELDVDINGAVHDDGDATSVIRHAEHCHVDQHVGALLRLPERLHALYSGHQHMLELPCVGIAHQLSSGLRHEHCDDYDSGTEEQVQPSQVLSSSVGREHDDEQVQHVHRPRLGHVRVPDSDRVPRGGVDHDQDVQEHGDGLQLQRMLSSATDVGGEHGDVPDVDAAGVDHVGISDSVELAGVNVDQHQDPDGDCDELDVQGMLDQAMDRREHEDRLQDLHQASVRVGDVAHGERDVERRGD